MLYYDKIDIIRGIYHSKSNGSNECKICHHRFFNHGFKFQDSVCSGCHDLIMLSAIITVKKMIIVVLFTTLVNLENCGYI